MVGFSRGIMDFGGIEELPGGTEELWAVIFCQPRCSELRSVQWWHIFPALWYSMQAMLSSFLAFVKFGTRNGLCTEYACRAKKGFLRYATRFQRPSVFKTGFWGTEGIFGTGNALLRYATHPQRRKTADSADCGQPSAAPDTFSEAQNSLLPHRMHLRMSCSSKTIP